METIGMGQNGQIFTGQVGHLINLPQVMDNSIPIYLDDP